MNYSKPARVSIKHFRLALFYCLCLSFLTACNKGSGANSDVNSNLKVSLGPAQTVTVGEFVYLTPTISNLGSRTITFQWIQTSGNPISLADNDNSYIEFTPLENDLLTFEVIVTDNQGSEYKDSLSITVLPNNEAGQYTAELNWTAPTENANGSVLTNLAGYKIYYGHSINNLDLSIRINDPQQSSLEIKNLNSDHSYFFCVAAYNAIGSEGQCSDAVDIQIYNGYSHS